MIVLNGSRVRPVNVIIDTTGVGGSKSITLRAVPVPVTFAYLAEKLAENGKWNSYLSYCRR